jgi:hypothetical protein
MENFIVPPRQIAYFCNSAPADLTPPDFSDHGYPERQKKEALAAAERFLDDDVKTIWKNGMDKFDRTKFDRGQVREQFFRLNVDPPEQYVSSVPASRKARLKPGESGFDNLILAGDWTRSILDVGCVEGAVISGKLAAAKISGHRPEILGTIGAKWEEIQGWS